MKWGELRSLHEPQEVLVLDTTPFVVGRNPVSNYVSTNPCISGRHCIFTFCEENWKVTLTDLSSNGCAVQGVRVGRDRCVPVLNGDVIDLVDVRTPKQEPYRLQFKIEIMQHVDRGNENDDTYANAETQPSEPTPKDTGHEERTKRLEEKYCVSGLCLGRGHYAEVWRAVRISDQLPVAVKIIKKNRVLGGSQSATSNVKMEREARILTRVEHENIVAVYDVFETEETVSIVLELCSGGDLFDFIQKQEPLDEAQALGIFKQLVHAVAYLHHNNIVHRDLKPENVLLTDATGGKVKITDFGLAKVFAALSPSEGLLTTICGTPMYVAPEVVEPQRRSVHGEYTSSVDVWSLGVVLWVMLTKRMPFPRAKDTFGKPTKRMDYSAELNFSLPVFDVVSEDCKYLLKRMICVEAADRISIDDVVEHTLLKSLNSKKRTRE